MKLVSKNINKDGVGEVKLMPQVAEDMWHVYNLVAHGDQITATSFRFVSLTLTHSLTLTYLHIPIPIHTYIHHCITTCYNGARV